MPSSTSLVLLIGFAVSTFAAPKVDLLIDHGFQKSGRIDLRDGVLDAVSRRKGQTFHFGSTYDTSNPNMTWTADIFRSFFNHVVAENECKWEATEPSSGVSNLTECIAVRDFATKHSDSFRGHNTFWHSQTPTWLPGNFSAGELVDTIIPTHVRAEIAGLGHSVTSWDVVNEVVGDNVTFGMTPLECVQNKQAWPTVTFDGSDVPLIKDLSFLHTAFRTAFEATAKNTRLALNEYSTGANNAKTACTIAVLKDIQKNTKVPFDRLAMGFQSHIQETSFVSKADLTNTFASLARIGVESMVTEIDIALTSGDEEDLRMQAAIWGDYLDACLFARNCNEFINWDTRDDVSWLGVDKAGTLFDKNGDPKPAAYEVAARLTRFARGDRELCATTLGIDSCRV
ncbi:glycoside hydrolase family 10 protein [Peniophora sp. CONT]|nr:glycoside hydrolase family 10 protein [Peniophora sp. CONT]